MLYQVTTLRLTYINVKGENMRFYNLSGFLNRIVLVIFFMMFFTACTTQKQQGVVGAVTTPLSDLNLIKEKIPVVLRDARGNPYALPLKAECTALTEYINTLDKVLGPDIDAASSGEKLTLFEEGSDAAQDAAVNTLDSTVKSFIPFRGWIRKLSGAERYSSLVLESISAGKFRRAFIKGFSSSKGCL